jgi:cell wall-associated NlpC family hydrolase
VAAAGLTTAVGLGTAAHAAPVNPSDGQINQAQLLKDTLATQIGQMSAQIAVMSAQVQQLQGAQELAEQKLANALTLLQQAKIDAARAKKNVATAQQAVVAAQAQFDGYVQATYINGPVTGLTGALLTAPDPNVLLQRGTLEQYQATHQLSAIGDLQRATVAKSNADAQARQAVAVQSQATAAAAQAKEAADAAVVAARQQQAQLEASLSVQQNQLAAAQLELATLNNERTAYIAWQKQQEELARERAAAAARARAAAEAAARARAAGGGGPSGPDVGIGSGGHWTAQAGQVAVARAERWLGTPYAWAGGNADGPTYGVCAGDGAFNDCNVVGFDCSGLVMYAWAQFPFAHYAATQYLQGSVHPSQGNLMPGDLVFWSSDGTVAGIHHVAIYIGGGMVIQAPESGDVIRETALDQVDGGYFGATRPLT